MKTNTLITTVLCSSIAGLTGVFAEVTAEADGHAEAKTSGNGTSETYIETTVTKNGVTTRKVEHKKNGRDVSGKKENSAEKESELWLGLRVTEASSALRDQLALGENEGVVVDLVASDGPAAKADLRENDILLKFEGKQLGIREDLRDALDRCQVGQTVTVEYLRRGEKEAAVTMEERPDGPEGEGGDPSEKMQERLRELREKHRAQGDGGNSIKIEVAGNDLEDLDEILKNPDVPENFKKSLREMQDRMREFKEKHGGN